MTPFENDLFASLLTEVDTPLPALVPEQETQLYQLILARSGIAAKSAQNRRIARRAWLVAALLAGLTLLAAGYYSVGDAFRGVLAEPVAQNAPAVSTSAVNNSTSATDPAGLRTKPVDKAASLVEKAGVLPLQSVTADGLIVTLRAAVFDEMSSRLIVDVASADGSSIAAQSDRIVERYGHHFHTTTLFVDGMEHPLGLSCNLLDMNDDGSDGSVSFLLDGGGLPADARQKNARLVLSDFIEAVGFQLQTDPALAAGETSLYALSQQLAPTDFTQFEVYEVTNREGVVTRNDYSRELPPAKPGIAFSALFPDAKIDTIFVKDNTLWIFGTSDNYETVEKIQSLQLKNLQTGKLLQVGGGSGAHKLNEQGSSLWSLRFNEAGDWQNLTLARPATGKSVLSLDPAQAPSPSDTMPDLFGGNDSYFLADGPWEISFPLDYEVAGRSFQPTDVSITLRDYPYLVSEVRISPFSGEIDLLPTGPRDPAAGSTRGWLDKEWQKIQLSLLLEDDRSIALDVHGSYDDETGAVQLRLSYFATEDDNVQNLVIDPEQVAAVQIGETRLPLS